MAGKGAKCKNGKIQCDNGGRGRNKVLALEPQTDAEAIFKSDRKRYNGE